MSLHQKVSSAIRILRWNRDVSARASHLVGVIHNFQAGSGNVSDSTFSERKIMSTKTTFKRVALTAVVALSVSGLTSVTAHAASADALAVSSTAVTGVIGQTSKVSVTQSFLSAVGSAESSTATAYLTSAPAGNTALPTWDTNTVAGTTNAGSAASVGAPATNYTTSGNTNIVSETSTAGVYVSHTSTLNFKPFVAGTYTVKLVPGINTAGVAGTANAASVTITYTVAAAAAPTAAASTVTAYVAGVAQTTAVYAAKATTTLVETVTVALSNSALLNTISISNVPAVTATITGAGSLALGNNGSQASGRSISSVAGTPSAQAADISPVWSVFSDNTSGVGTITFTTVDASGATIVLGTTSLTFYGAAAKITPTVVNTVGVVGANLGAVTAIVTDASGTPVANAHVYAVSDATTVINDAYTSSTAVSDSDGKVTFNLTGASKGTANITLTTNSSSASTSGVSSAPVAVRIGTTTVASYKLTLDKDTYAPGEIATATLAAIDAAGLPVADTSTADGALSSNFATAAGSIQNYTFSNSAKVTTTGTGAWVFKFNAPVTAADLKITFTPTDTTLAATSASATVTGGVAGEAAQAAIDAAQEATDAANAAYDAANNAMDSADAATAAAQDAADNASAALAAVTSLSATVAKLVKSVAAIAAALAKVQKKIGA